MRHEKPPVIKGNKIPAHKEGQESVMDSRSPDSIDEMASAVTGSWTRDDSKDKPKSAIEIVGGEWRAAHQAEALVIDEALGIIINNRNDNEIIAFLQDKQVNIPALAKADGRLNAYMDQFKQDIYYNREQEEQFGRIMDAFIKKEKKSVKAA